VKFSASKRKPSVQQKNCLKKGRGYDDD